MRSPPGWLGCLVIRVPRWCVDDRRHRAHRTPPSITTNCILKFFGEPVQILQDIAAEVRMECRLQVDRHDSALVQQNCRAERFAKIIKTEQPQKVFGWQFSNLGALIFAEGHVDQVRCASDWLPPARTLTSVPRFEYGLASLQHSPLAAASRKGDRFAPAERLVLWDRSRFRLGNRKATPRETPGGGLLIRVGS